MHTSGPRCDGLMMMAYSVFTIQRGKQQWSSIKIIILINVKMLDSAVLEEMLSKRRAISPTHCPLNLKQLKRRGNSNMTFHARPFPF